MSLFACSFYIFVIYTYMDKLYFYPVTNYICSLFKIMFKNSESGVCMNKISASVLLTIGL